MVIGSGISSLGSSLFGGGAQKAATKEQGREFDVSSMPQLARLYQSAPLRDKLLAIMGNLATTGPTPFQPTDIFNPGARAAQPNPNAALGARPQSAFNLPAGYQDNSGAYQEMLRQALHTLGYHQFDPQDQNAPAAPATPFGQRSTGGYAGGATGNPATGQRPYFGAPVGIRR